MNRAHYYTLVVLFWISCISISYAQQYKGTIGAYPILLSLEVYDDGTIDGYYYYDTQLKNIPLTGKKTETTIVVHQRFSEPQEKKELFTLTIAEKQLKGTWEQGTKVLPVSLTLTDLNVKTYKRKKISFIRDSIATYGTKELVWLTEKFSKKALFRLGNGFTKTQRALINPKLDSIHMQYAEIGLECGWADFTAAVTLVSDQYLSFHEFSSIYCGGAHPSHHTGGYTFDLTKYTEIKEINDLYPNVAYYPLLKQKYQNDPDLEPECEFFEYDGEFWEYHSWVLSPEGIVLTPSYPHAMTPCEIQFVLTYEELGQGN